VYQMPFIVVAMHPITQRLAVHAIADGRLSAWHPKLARLGIPTESRLHHGLVLCFAAAAGIGWVPGPVMPKDLGSPEQAARAISKPRARIARMQKFVPFLRNWPIP
jgi:hypothetical protein